jgi:Domain of unknown function (DUF6883)
MKIPNASQVVVPQAKVVDYLLSETHVVGRHKAVVFRAYGFAAANWELLADALKRHALQHEVAKEEISPYGRRLVVEGIMEVPDGQSPSIRTVWFLRNEETTPRFVTAYPLK